MNEELEEALDILNAAINNDRYLLNDNQIRTLIDLRNRLLHCNEFSSSDKDRGLFLVAASRVYALRQLDSRKKELTAALPPSTPEFFLYLFMTPANCDALVGDLEERYKLIRKKFGRRRANFWYWTQTVRSLGPIVWAWAKKVSLKPVVAVVGWAVGKGLLGHDGWLAALVELLKKVRS
jgi:hypothetical protein